MKILREKLFGLNKRINKAKRRAWEIEESFKTYGKEAFNHGMVRPNGRPVTPEEEAIRMTRYERRPENIRFYDNIAHKQYLFDNDKAEFIKDRKSDARIEAEMRNLDRIRREERAERVSKVSVEKHRRKAEEIRNNNKLNVAARDAKRWIKKNPGKAAAIGAAFAGGLGYAAYKHNKNKKENKK